MVVAQEMYIRYHERKNLRLGGRLECTVSLVHRDGSKTVYLLVYI